MARETEKDESGLSFEAEPTGLPQRPTHGRNDVEPGRDSTRADFTPGADAKGRSVWTGGAMKFLAIVLLVAALILALYWLA